MSELSPLSLPMPELSPVMMERIDAGWAYMDENLPDWREIVDPGILDMCESSRCVLGQYWIAKYPEKFYDEHYAYLTARNELAKNHDNPLEWASAYGFTNGGQGPYYSFYELTEGWRQKFREMSLVS